MKTRTQVSTRLALAVGAALLLASSAGYAQNAARGKQLYEAAIVPNYLSCSAPGACHGADPLANLNNVRRGTSGAVILAAISTVPLMGPFSGRVTNADAADMAAYINNPASATAPAISASATALAFGSAQVATAKSTSTPASITLTNSGASTLNITGIARSGANSAEFVPTGSCVSASTVAVAAGASCTLGATFTPTATGNRSAMLTVQSNAATNPTISLTGTGSSVPVPSVALSRTTVTFPTQTLGTASGAQQVTLTNSGSGPLTVTQIAAAPTPEFAATSNCVATVAAGASCTINVTFLPSAAGTRTGSLTITSNGGGSPHSVTLSGVAVLSATGIASAARSNVQFPTTVIGASVAPESTDITNTGNAALQIASVAINGTNAGDFKLGPATSCAAGSSVAPNASCRLDVEFRPQGAGTKSATVVVNHNGPGGTTALDVSGTAAVSPQFSSALAPSNIGGGGAASPSSIAMLLLGALLAVAFSGRRIGARHTSRN